MDPIELYGDSDYEGPVYVRTKAVENLRGLPRFGYTSDATSFFSPNQEDQAEYTAGVILIVFVTLTGFLFWTVAILTLKCMGPGNAGFLSGHPFMSPDPADDDKKEGFLCLKCTRSGRPFRVRVAFLVASGVLVLYAVLLVTMGLTNVENAAVTAQRSVEAVREIGVSSERISRSLEEVGIKSVQIRDAAVEELEEFCPDNPRLDEQTGVNFMEIANSAKADLTNLANFIEDGLAVLNPVLKQVQVAADDADDILEKVDLWGWQAKLLVIALFVLPSCLVVGVGLVMLGVDIPMYQKFLTYLIMPLFAVTIICCYIFSSAILPLSAVSADVCTGGPILEGGPDDTILTVFRNLRGDDQSIVFQVLAYYTQRCDSEYYPFGFLSEYLDQLDGAISSTETVVDQVSNNLGLLELQCGKSFEPFVRIAQAMNTNLDILKTEAANTLNLVSCKNINRLYVNTIHEATCTYAVDALAWIYSCSFIVAVCGMLMITLRAAYYPVQDLELSEGWRASTRGMEKKMLPPSISPEIIEPPTKSESSDDGATSPTRVDATQSDSNVYEVGLASSFNVAAAKRQQQSNSSSSRMAML